MIIDAPAHLWKNEISQEKRLLLGENAKSFYGFGDLEISEKIKNMVE